jgi:hypothetical protein
LASPADYLDITPALARSLNNLSVRLGEVGRRDEGLPAQRGGGGRAPAANPAAYEPALAISINILSIRLGGAGRHSDGKAGSIGGPGEMTLAGRSTALSPDTSKP